MAVDEIPEWILQLLLLAVGIIGSGTVYYYLAQHRPRSAAAAAILGLGLLGLAIVGLRRNARIRAQAKSNAPTFSGRITPGKETTPDVPSDAFSLLLGDDLQVLAQSSEHHVLSKGNDAFLKLRIQGGLLLVSATVVDSTGAHIVTLIDNEFQASAERAFNPTQPDSHSLVVRDLAGNEVLNIRYLNPRVIRVLGRFHVPGFKSPVEVLPDDGIRWPGGGGIAHLTLDMRKAPNAGVIRFG